MRKNVFLYKKVTYFAISGRLKLYLFEDKTNKSEVRGVFVINCD